MAGFGVYQGMQPGMQSASNGLMFGPALAQQAYADEYKKAAESSLILKNLEKVAAEAQAKLGDEQRAREAPGRFDRAAAANYGTTLPDMAQARDFIANPESPLIEGPRWTDSPEFGRARQAVSEAEIASANPDKNTLTNFGSYRQNMTQVPGEAAKSDAITRALAAAVGGDTEGAYDIAGPVLGHKPPTDASNSLTTFVKNMKAAGIEPASPEGRKMLRDYLVKQSTHAPGATMNNFGAPTPVNTVRPDGSRTPGFIVTDKQGGQRTLEGVEPYTPPPRTIEEGIVRNMPPPGQPRPAPAPAAKPAAAAKDPATDPKAVDIRARMRSGAITRDQAKAELQALGYQ